MNTNEIDNKWFPFGLETDKPVKYFCFPHAGGSANVFRKWMNYSQDSDIEIIPVEYPGRATRLSDKIHACINDMAIEIATAIFDAISEEKYVLYGHSFGALVAFQTEYILEQKYHMKADAVVVSGRQAPNMEDASQFRTWMGEEALINEMIQMKTINEELLENEMYLKFFLPIIMKDYSLNEKYVYNGEVLNAPIIAFSSADDMGAEPEIMVGWENMTKSGFVLKRKNGAHFFVYEEERAFYDELLREVEKGYEG